MLRSENISLTSTLILNGCSLEELNRPEKTEPKSATSTTGGVVVRRVFRLVKDAH